MDVARWSRELTVGEPSLDTAHHRLFGELRQLAGAEPKAFLDQYDNVIAAVEDDFRAEEDIMEQLVYPGLASHREQHARALSGLHHAGAALAEGNAGPAHQAVVLLADWLQIHITTMDQALAQAIAMAPSAPAGPAVV